MNQWSLTGHELLQILFLMPLFFQVVLLDSPSKAGFRLIPPSLATPLGGVTTGFVMTRRDSLISMTRVGLLMLLANCILLLSLSMSEPEWKYSAYMMLGNFGQGMVFPASLFAFLRTVERGGQ